MTSVLDQAQNFSGGVVSAARKRESWLRRAANATDPEVKAQYEEAAADLAGRYPDIEDLEIGEAEKFARERGHGRSSRSPTHEGRSRRRPGTTKRSSSEPRSEEQEEEEASPSKRKLPLPKLPRPEPRPTPKVDRAIRETGIPSAASSGGSAVLAALGGTVGLSLLYLLLSSAEKPGSGGAALPNLIGAVTGFLGRFLAPNKDLFPSNGPPTSTFQVKHGAHGKPHTVTYEGQSTVATAAARLKKMEARQKKHARKGN